jgi:phosphatidylglycerol:prolipoprotein diacylglycerol transferase
MAYDATITKIFDMPPYFFFYVVGVVFASSVFMLLLLKYHYSIPHYTKIFFISAAGLLAGAKLFGFLAGLYRTLANKEAITKDTFFNTGIVFYGGLIGFLLSFLFICRIWNKEIAYGVVDLAAVCIPLFHFWGRLGCFFAGCCYGIESHSAISVLYTNHTEDGIVTASRFPIQLIEAILNLMIFVVLMILLFRQKFKGHLLIVYLCIYATIRIILELFRGDLVRGVWNGVSFSQMVSVLVLVSCVTITIVNKEKKKLCGIG